MLEMMAVLAIASVLIALSIAALDSMPQRARLAGEVMEFNSTLAAARSHAVGRDVRAAVLINTEVVANGTRRIRYWTVLDPNFTIRDVMRATPNWQLPEDLVTATDTFQVINNGQFSTTVRLNATGFRAVVGNNPHASCSALAGRISLVNGTGGGNNTFPAPYCMVPDDQPCTFCTNGRGAVLFEPDGRVRLVDSIGTPEPRGAGSLVLDNATIQTPPDPRAIVLLNTGLFRVYDNTRR